MVWLHHRGCTPRSVYFKVHPDSNCHQCSDEKHEVCLEGWLGNHLGALQNVPAQLWALVPVCLTCLLPRSLTRCLHWSRALRNTQQGTAGEALNKHWAGKRCLFRPFTSPSFPPSSWDSWTCSQAPGSSEQQLCALSTASDLSSSSQDLWSGEGKSEHLAGPREKLQNKLLCMITKIKAFWRATSDTQGAGVKLWSLGMTYLCLCGQWQTGLGGQEDECCPGATAWRRSELRGAAVVGRLCCCLQSTSAGALKGVRSQSLLLGQSVIAVRLRAYK